MEPKLYFKSSKEKAIWTIKEIIRKVTDDLNGDQFDSVIEKIDLSKQVRTVAWILKLQSVPPGQKSSDQEFIFISGDNISKVEVLGYEPALAIQLKGKSEAIPRNHLFNDYPSFIPKLTI